MVQIHADCNVYVHMCVFVEQQSQVDNQNKYK